MHININNCPSELRRFVASPYVVIQKYNKAYYLKKQYWAKIYEVEYSLLKNPLSVRSADETEETVPGSARKSFVAATGDEIGLFGEGTTADDAALELQVRLSSSILQLLEEGQSHCLPSKRKHHDVLLKDFEEEMMSHGVKILSPPKYVQIKVAFDIVSAMKPLPSLSNAVDADASIEQPQEQMQPPPSAPQQASPPPQATSLAPPPPQQQQEPAQPQPLQQAPSIEAPLPTNVTIPGSTAATEGSHSADPSPNPNPSPS